MNKLWKLRIKRNLVEEGKREHKRKWLNRVVFFLLVFIYLNPQSCLHLQYWKRIIYPVMFGKKTAQPQVISVKDYYEDVDIDTPNIVIIRNDKEYVLVPRTIYKATGRVGIVDNYDSWWHKNFGAWNCDFEDISPRDFVMLTGKMAEPEIFDMFDFVHGYRYGGPVCKGFKCKSSMLKCPRLRMKYQKYNEIDKKCFPYLNFSKGEYDNYHPIPATKNIDRALSIMIKGDVLSLEGFLVDVPQLKITTPTRKGQYYNYKDLIDGLSGTAPGRCLILYVTKVIVNGVEYQ